MLFVVGIVAVGAAWNVTGLVVAKAGSDGELGGLLGLAALGVIGQFFFWRWALTQDVLREHYTFLLQMQWAFWLAPLGILLFHIVFIDEWNGEAVGSAIFMVGAAVALLLGNFGLLGVIFGGVGRGDEALLLQAIGGSATERYFELTHSKTAILSGIAAFTLSGLLYGTLRGWRRPPPRTFTHLSND
ncbi:hypothetical protein SAMN05660657_05538 [Geodermatophilus amargosae]|uniref:Uncharacterized protein n=1 Tax=Geodermatophilus amargosae TaxID=1296565 RepID=A0A1I7DA62_9ACTN|nr:hypothetical protein [Geodermatophilus amargosae]SFU08571.1 hypothetical protein SAMN05660657_05538 [Geodermatophilus amargosae]